MVQHLGEHYVIIPSRDCGSDFGFPIARLRQITILVLREWVFANLRTIGRSDLCADAAVQRLVDLTSTLSACCRRTCGITWRDCLVGTDEDHAEEHRRTAARPAVMARWSDVAAGKRRQRVLAVLSCQYTGMTLATPRWAHCTLPSVIVWTSACLRADVMWAEQELWSTSQTCHRSPASGNDSSGQIPPRS